MFIKSQVGPELQIDVPIEIANRLYEKAAGKYPEHGPYLFREAQVNIFKHDYYCCCITTSQSCQTIHLTTKDHYNM